MHCIDIEESKKKFCEHQGCEEPFCEEEDGYGVCCEMERFLKYIKNDVVTVDAIPVPFIINRIRETSGAESSYLSRLIRRYREVYHA